MLQPYFRAYLKEKGLTVDNFKGVDYILWIERKHEEFLKQSGLTCLESHTPKYYEQFCKFLGVERSGDSV